MGIFDNLKKQPEPAKSQRHVDIYPEDRQTFEKICAKENIKCSFQPMPSGSIRCTFDADLWPILEKYFSAPEPEPEPAPKPEEKKGFSLDDLIAGTKKEPEPRPAPTPATPPRPAAATRQPDYLEKMGLTNQPAAPTERENRWAEEKLTEELKEIQAEIDEADALLASDQEPAAEAAGKKQRKKRKSKGRTNQIMTRLTDAELTKFKRRVEKSGLPQGDYLRSVALTGKVVIEEHSVADVALLEELALIRAELGRQGGLLKMVVQPNKGQRELAPAEWAALMDAIQGLDEMKKRLSDLEVRVTHGNRETQDQQKRPVR